MADKNVADKQALIEQIMRARRGLRRVVAQDQSHPLLETNLTMPQLKVMIVLSELGGASGQELARRMGAGLPTLTGIVDRLVAQGLVSRREDSRDRRVRRLDLTPTGADLINRLVAAGEDHQQRLLQRLDLPSLQIVAQAFEAMLSAASAEDAQGRAVEPPGESVRDD